MARPLTIILLSGMGDDQRLLAPQRAAIPDLVVPAWITPVPGESLADYARRMAEPFDPDEPCIVGGMSFGGMVAQEMASHLRAEACVLIATIRGSHELPWRLAWLLPLVRWIPAAAVAAVQLVARWVHPLARMVFPFTTAAIVAHFADADPRLLCWAFRAVFLWEPTGSLGTTPVFHIHGSRDWILPASRTHPDRVVPGAGHLITLSHPREVNDFLREVCRTVQDRDGE